MGRKFFVNFHKHILNCKAQHIIYTTQIQMHQRKACKEKKFYVCFSEILRKYQSHQKSFSAILFHTTYILSKKQLIIAIYTKILLCFYFYNNKKKIRFKKK